MEYQSKDVLFKILLALPIKDLLSTCQTSKRFREICRDEAFWRLRLIQDFKINTRNNAKETYLEILKNKELCLKVIPKLTSENYKNKYVPENIINKYVLRTIFAEFFQDINRYPKTLIINFIEDKVLPDELVSQNPEYIPNIYRRFISNIVQTDPYFSFLTPEKKVSQEEIDFYFSELSDLRNNLNYIPPASEAYKQIINFFKLVLDGVLERRIPFDVKYDEICNYPLF